MEIVYIVFNYIGSFTVTPAASELIVPFTTIFLYLLAIFLVFGAKSLEAKKWLLAFLILGVVAITTRLGLQHLALKINLYADYSPQYDQIVFLAFFSYPNVIWSFAYLCLGIFAFVHWGSSRMHLNIKNLLFSLSGRIPRSAFWVSLCIIACLNYRITNGAYEVLLHSLSGQEIPPIVYPKIAIWVAWAIAHFWIFLSISIKRLHDCSKSGYWLFVMLIPFLGPLILIGYLGFVRGNDGENQYGDDSLVAQTG